MIASPQPAAASRPVANRLRLGTRGSALAVAQSSTIADALRGLGADVELVTIRTLGDDRPPDTTWGEGAFVGALEAALLDAAVDLAVHSAKDVPTTEHPRLAIAAYPRRADPRDALVGREPGASLEGLPLGARVGTDSPRRTAFLLTVRPDLQVHPLHGNVDTRLRRLDEGVTDALVLAVAGLTRLGRADRIGQILSAELVPPAPGQGALAIQCRADDEVTRSWLAQLDDRPTRAAVEAEREFLGATGGGCRAPIGALGRIEGDEIVLHGATAGTTEPIRVDGERPAIARGEVRGPIADRLRLAAGLASRLTAELAGTGDELLRRPASNVGRRVLVTRAAARADALVGALASRGLEPLAIPTIETRPVEPGGALDAALLRVADASWIAVTSANGASAVLDAARRLGMDLSGARWAAVGPATTSALEARGVHVAFTPTTSDAAALAAELPIGPGEGVLLPQSDLADRHLAAALEARGAAVEAAVAYSTDEGPEGSRERIRALFAAGDLGAIVFTSGSTVRGLLSLLGSTHRRVARRTLAACIGEPTATVARAAGFELVLVAPSPDPAALADLVAASVLLPIPDPAPEPRQEVPS